MDFVLGVIIPMQARHSLVVLLRFKEVAWLEII